MVDKKGDAKIALKDLLFKLGIKSAEVHFMERAMLKMLRNYGQPDILMMPGSVLSTYLEAIGHKKDD